MPGPYPTTLKAEGIANTPVAKQSFIRMMAARTLSCNLSVSKGASNEGWENPVAKSRFTPYHPRVRKSVWPGRLVKTSLSSTLSVLESKSGLM